MEALATRCPHCATAFRVTQEQLQAHQGQVRCGRCHNVFDAFASLSTVPSNQALPEQETAQSDDAISEAQSTAAPGTGDGTAQSADAVQPERAVVATPSFLLDYGSAPPPPAGKSRRGLWLSGSLLLLVALLAQGAYFFRSEIAVRYEWSRPLLVAYCEWLQCKVELPRPQQQLDIAASDLQAAGPDQPGRIVLSALLRNRAAVAAAYPALELTLTDAQERTVARRVFLPGEYLQQAADQHAGLAAGAEASVQLHLDSGDIVASGYRLYLFYP